MIITIDFNSPDPIYVQLRNQIVRLIAQQRLKDGDSLPSVRAMAMELGVNMHTVNKAYAILRQEGYLQLDRRKGAVICVRCEKKNDEIMKINEDMEMLVAQAICKEITREDMLRLVEKMYDAFM